MLRLYEGCKPRLDTRAQFVRPEGLIGSCPRTFRAGCKSAGLVWICFRSNRFYEYRRTVVTGLDDLLARFKCHALRPPIILPISPSVSFSSARISARISSSVRIGLGL